MDFHLIVTSFQGVCLRPAQSWRRRLERNLVQARVVRSEPHHLVCQRRSPPRNLPSQIRCLPRVLVVPRQAPQHPVYFIVFSKRYSWLIPTVTLPKSQRATVEEVEDEDNIKTPSQKKKKKKSKKKKSASAEATPASPPSVQSVDSTASHKTSIPLTPPSPSSQPYAAPKTSYNASMASLTLKETTTAQSSHSYLQKENLMKSDKKIKSRPDHASLFSNAEEKRGLFSSKFSSASKGEVKPKESDKSNWFSKLGKKTTGLMHQLLRPGDEQKRARAPMKWEHFLKVSIH